MGETTCFRCGVRSSEVRVFFGQPACRECIRWALTPPEADGVKGDCVIALPMLKQQEPTL